MIVISQSLVLSAGEAALDPDCPLIGWHSIVTASGIAASSTAAGYSASDLANPATHLQWRGASAAQIYLTVTTGYGDPIDYVAVARHNFHTAQIPVAVEGYISGVWTELTDEVILPDDGPALFRFSPTILSAVRLRLDAGAAAPRCAVLYCGKLLVMERRLYAGYTPLPHARKANVSSGRSESGNFLGRIVLGEWRESEAPFSLLSPTWYRTYMDAFCKASKDAPFFFAWRPQSYPLEVGYGWLTDDVEPQNVGPSNLIALTLKIAGVA